MSEDEIKTCEICGDDYPEEEMESDKMCLNCASSFLQPDDGIMDDLME